MCGITGAWTSAIPGSPPSQAAVRAMTAALAHRGPDGCGSWASADTGLSFGHARLAIVELSDAGSQPMELHETGEAISFNGEIYNHHELRDALPTRRWRGGSDTETLLVAISEWGLRRTLEAARGMFALAYWNPASGKLQLAIDRFGEKPLYYCQCNDALLFGSELKALRTHPSFDGETDPASTDAFLRRGYIPAPHTIYKGCSKLPPGTIATFENRHATPVLSRYWSLDAIISAGQQSRFSGSLEDAAAETAHLLKSAVQEQLQADVPVGALLSGGVDSTLVCSLATRVSSSTVRTFSAAFANSLHDESSSARQTAERLGTEHHELRVDEAELIELIPDLPYIYDEPFADSSQIPTCAISRLAREHVTVALSGDGADELFGGYNRYMLAPQIWKAAQRLPRQARRAVGQMLSMLPTDAINGLARYLPVVSRYRLPGIKVNKLGQRLKTCNSALELYANLTAEWEPGTTLVEGVSGDRGPWSNLDSDLLGTLSFREAMMFADSATYLPGDVLTKVDRASMSTSLELRAPFLDHRIAELAWQLPMEFRATNKDSKRVLRRILAADPRHLTHSQAKKGFSVPLEDWLRGPLRGWAEEHLNKTHLESHIGLNPRPVLSAWHDLLRGYDSHCYRIWSVIMLSSWIAAEQRVAA